MFACEASFYYIDIANEFISKSEEGLSFLLCLLVLVGVVN